MGVVSRARSSDRLSLAAIRGSFASAMRASRRCLRRAADNGEPDCVNMHWFTLLGNAGAAYMVCGGKAYMRMRAPMESAYYKRAVAVRDARRVA